VNTDGLERETKGFRVLRLFVPQERSNWVWLELNHVSFREIFEVMAEDVAGRILAAQNEASAVAAMRERLNHWERFMSASGAAGLSRERQIGLYGELTFLKTMLASGTPAVNALTWWHGPDSKNQDFQAGKRGLEVKTTTSNSSTIIRISNELQLDNSECEPLYLLHLWLRELDGAGLSLPDLIDGIIQQLDDSAAQNFADRLVVAGYHEIHRPFYEDSGYVERARRYYAVEDNFPCIRRADLRPAVSRVEYQIDLAGFESFARDEPTVLASFTIPPA
jgi:hypothetical protein